LDILSLCYVVVFVFFFFSSRRRHTRSKRDWSSDVCSSDLYLLLLGFLRHKQISLHVSNRLEQNSHLAPQDLLLHFLKYLLLEDRSEERRVGKECRSRRWPYH